LLGLSACSAPGAMPPKCAVNGGTTVRGDTRIGLFFGLLKLGNSPKVNILEFLASSAGNSSPRRVVHLNGMFASGPYGVDAAGNFWSGFTRYNDRGVAMGSLNLLRSGWIVGPLTVDSAGNFYAVEGRGSFVSRPCPYFGNVFVDEYPAGIYGSPTPGRSINIGNSACHYGGVAVDRLGRVYVAENPGTSGEARIVVLPARGSGQLKPTRVITPPRLGQLPPTVGNLQVDADGDVFVLYLDATPNDNRYRVLMYGPTAHIAREVLLGVRVYAFAILGNGEIDAMVPVASNIAIERYRIGTSQPISILAGRRTGLSRRGWIPNGIAVPRSGTGCLSQ
jgi:hypothetical protein